MEIKQYRYGYDNFSYLMCTEKQALAIDGGAVDKIADYVESTNRTLKIITNTHSHPDHTVGNQQLLKKTNAKFMDHSLLSKKGFIELDDEKIEVFATPGHTQDSVVFRALNALITGDTLFNGTVGNCFSGDLDGFFQSIKQLMQFPLDTKIYAGHDYVLEALRFAKDLEPNNEEIDVFQKEYSPDHVVSTLADELRVNTFLRFSEPSIIDMLESRGLPCGTELERWRSLMED
ncbi:MAG: MBL fold metallo-hydrolase [Proteobacteria bacterium]|nr:MBL fold metallo-hydrolase [Pseudomonadota bacterium]